MANTLNDLLAALDDSVAMEKSAQDNSFDVSELSMDELIKLAEDEGERAAAEMAAADDKRLATDKQEDEAKADEERAEAKKDDSEAKKDDEKMDKEAFLKKLAEIVVSDNGGAEEDMVNAPTAEMVAMDDAKVKPQPGTTEGAGNLVQAIMASAEEAASDTGSGVEVGDGDDMAEPEEDQVTKAAALDNLMSAGFSFEEAADMVKAASDAVEAEAVAEYSDMDKAAAVGQLMAQGIDFADAVELVKQAAPTKALAAEARKAFKGVAKKVSKGSTAAHQAVVDGGAAMGIGAGKAGQRVMDAGKAVFDKGHKRTGLAIGHVGNAVQRAGKAMYDHPRTTVGAAAGALAAGGAGAAYAAGHKKKAEYTDMDKAAAVGMLMDQGIDFDTAVAAVQEAAE